MKTLNAQMARALAVVWAGFWSFFFIAESLAWHAPFRVTAFWAGVALCFVALALVPWLWQTAGGVLLVLAGPAIAAAYAAWSPANLTTRIRVITAAILGAPPVFAGALFLTHPRAITRRA